MDKHNASVTIVVDDEGLHIGISDKRSGAHIVDVQIPRDRALGALWGHTYVPAVAEYHVPVKAPLGYNIEIKRLGPETGLGNADPADGWEPTGNTGMFKRYVHPETKEVWRK